MTMMLWTAATTLAAVLAGTVTADTLHHIPLVPHHVQKARRSLQSTNDVVRRRRSLQLRSQRDLQLQVGALYQGYGTHYVDMWTGTPPQRQTVIVDTGSGVTAFPCSGCTDCGEEHHTDKYFIEADSSTFHRVGCGECTRGRCGGDKSQGCRIGMSYQEGSSWSAYEARDVCYIGGPHTMGLEEGQNKNKKKNDLDPSHANRFSFKATFGCQTKLTGLFKTQLADGIMGMDNAATAFWLQAYNAGVIKKKNFSLCYSRQPTATREGTESGALTLGGFDRRLHRDNQNGVVYSPMANGRSGFFSVRVRKMYLRQGGGGDSAKSTDPSLEVLPLDASEAVLNQGSIIVDSGTTDTYFTRRIASAFSDAWKHFTNAEYGHDPTDLTEAQLDNLPTILIQIEGDMKMNGKLAENPDDVVGLAGSLDPDHPYDIVVAVPPSHYMEWDSKNKKYVARFYTDEGSGSVLGGNTMMGHDVNFDVDNGRIGWAESTCDYTRLVNENGSVFTLDEEVEDTEVKKEEQQEALDEDDDDTGGATENDDTQGEPSAEDNDDEVDVEDIKTKKPETGKSTLDALKSAPYAAAKSCKTPACQGGVAAVVLVTVLVILFAVRRMRRGSRIAYQQAELEVGELSFHDDDELDSEDFVRYRDNPRSYDDDLDEEDAIDDEDDEESDDGVADEGVGYDIEPEGHKFD